MILDRNLPLLHGDDICRSLSSSGAMVRILMLTAAGDLVNRSKGSVSAPMTTWPSRSRSLSSSPGSGPWAGGPPARSAGPGAGRYPARPGPPGGRENRLRLPLRHKELAVLAELLRCGGAIVSAEQLLEKAWDENIDPFTHVVRVTIMTLRRKLGQPPLIETVPGTESIP